MDAAEREDAGAVDDVSPVEFGDSGFHVLGRAVSKIHPLFGYRIDLLAGLLFLEAWWLGGEASVIDIAKSGFGGGAWFLVASDTPCSWSPERFLTFFSPRPTRYAAGVVARFSPSETFASGR